MKMKKSLALRAMLAKPGIIVAPGVTTALFARLIEDTGFSAQFVTGAGLANIHFGLPDYNPLKDLEYGKKTENHGK